MFGVCFHYFQGNRHIPCQGSLTQEQFRRVLDDIQARTHLVNADRFLEDALSHSGTENEACITFDCGLRSQYDLALPVLEAYGIRAFWLLYTGALNGGIVKIEQYHHFRFSCFRSILEFYHAFFDLIGSRYQAEYPGWKNSFKSSGYLEWAEYYTPEDRFYKYLRDRCLSEAQFSDVMDEMMQMHGYDINQYRNLLWLDRAQIHTLSEKGHVIGMHTHTHPFEIGRLSYEAQMQEYQTNQAILNEVTGQKIICMSHPCNSYNEDTLRVLKNLGVQIGFRANEDPQFLSNLLIPRVDHATWIRRMKENNLWR